MDGSAEYKIYRHTKKQILKKKIAIYSLPQGGTVTENIPPEKQEVQALADDRIIELAGLGQKIEAHYGSEQDIEWELSMQEENSMKQIRS